MTGRLTFSVGVSSPSSCERSRSRIVEALDLLDAREAGVDRVDVLLDRRAHARVARHRRQVGGDAELLRELRRLVGVEREQRDEVGAGGRRATTACEIQRVSRSALSMFSGEMFLPLEVMMRSFLRPVMCR